VLQNLCLVEVKRLRRKILREWLVNYLTFYDVEDLVEANLDNNTGREHVDNGYNIVNGRTRKTIKPLLRCGYTDHIVLSLVADSELLKDEPTSVSSNLVRGKFNCRMLLRRWNHSLEQYLEFDMYSY